MGGGGVSRAGLGQGSSDPRVPWTHQAQILGIQPTLQPGMGKVKLTFLICQNVIFKSFFLSIYYTYLALQGSNYSTSRDLWFTLDDNSGTVDIPYIRL